MKAQSRERWAQPRDLAFNMDPGGLIHDERQRDEYDFLVGPLMRMLERNADEGEIAAFVRREFSDHFGLSDFSIVDRFSNAVKARYNESWPESTVAEGAAE